MKRFAILILLLTFGASSLLAQQAQTGKTPDKDADKKNPPASKGAKKDQKKDEKKEEPKDEKKEEPKDEKKEEPKDEKKGGMNADTFSGLKFRLIGPGAASGRVMSIAVNPRNRFEYYVGVA